MIAVLPVVLTPNFTAAEFACHDSTPYPLTRYEEDGTGRLWLETRLLPLCRTLEIIRAAAGGEPITITSGYRTAAYQARLYAQSARDGSVASASGSQHPAGRAADLTHASMPPKALHALVLRLWDEGRLPEMGGVGIYPTFVHVDVRPRAAGHLAQWSGARGTNSVA